jgi:hypothetical protein
LAISSVERKKETPIKFIMKHLLILIISVLLFNQAGAQITITSADMPSVGDTVRTSIALNPEVFDFSQTGENHFWDYSGLNPINQRVDTFLAVSSTPVAFWPFFITSADLANTFNPASILPGLPDEMAYRFLESSDNRYQDLGYGLIFEGTPIPLKYSNADEIYQFPMSFGHSYADDALLELALPNVGYVLLDRSRQNTIDGWGTLTTPYGSFEVLRYKSEVEEYDSLFINGIGQAIAHNYTEYHWLAQGMDVPLLQVTLDEVLGSFVVYRDSARVISVGLSESQQAHTELQIYPNPARQNSRILVDAKKATLATLSIFDQQGKMVYRNQRPLMQGQNVIFLNANQHFTGTGLYTIQIIGEGIRSFGKLLLLE